MSVFVLSGWFTPVKSVMTLNSRGVVGVGIVSSIPKAVSGNLILDNLMLLHQDKGSPVCILGGDALFSEASMFFEASVISVDPSALIQRV